MNEYLLVSKLYDNIYSDRKYGNNRSAYTFILGDYNIPLEFCHECELIYNLSTKTFLGGKLFPNERTTLIKKESYLKAIENNETPDIFASDYDHCSYNIDHFIRRDVFVKVTRVNSVEKYCSNEEHPLIKHIEKLSDHVPIKIEITLR